MSGTPAATPSVGLAALVAQLRYKPGWRFALVNGPSIGSGGITGEATPSTTATWTTAWTFGVPATLVISAQVPDSDNPAETGQFTHYFPIYPCVVDDAFWRRWLIERILDVERHEAMEAFWIGDQRPFYPGHGPDGRLYDIVDNTEAHDERLHLA